jgi:site-specific DNA-adenine methylase
MRSPLRVATKNFKALSVLKTIIPLDSIVHSFLFFDGNLEIGLAHDGRFVVAHTNKYVIYEFWYCVRKNPQRIVAAAEYFQPIEDKNIFYLLQESWPKYHDPFVRSALFLLLNRYSASGQISSGDFYPEAYRPTDLVSLSRIGFNSLHLSHDPEDNFLEAIEKIEGRCDFVFLPIGSYSLNYMEDARPQGFEETTVVHRDIKKMMEETSRKVVLLYKTTSKVLALYRDYKMYFIDKWGRAVEDRTLAEEVLIVNF